MLVHDRVPLPREISQRLTGKAALPAASGHLAKQSSLITTGNSLVLETNSLLRQKNSLFL